MGFESWFSERNRYEKCLFISLGINLLILVPIILGILLHWWLTQDKICNNKDCVLMAETVYYNYNESVDPCKNFYKFACDGYTTFYHKKGFFRKIRNVKNFYTESNKNLFKEPNPKYPRALRYLTDYLHCCMNQENFQNEYRILQKIAKELKFPATTINRNDWTETDYDYEKLMIDLIDRGLHYQAFFQFYVDYPLTNEAVPSFIFSAPREVIVHETKPTSNIFSYFAGILHEFNLVTEMAIEDGIFYEQFKKELFEANYACKLHFDRLPLYRKVNFEYILKEYPNIMTENIMNKILSNNEKITKNTEIYIPNNDHDLQVLKNANDLLSKPGFKMKRTITNFIIYRALLYAEQFIHVSIYKEYIKMEHCVKSLSIDKRLQFSFRLNFYYENVKAKELFACEDLVENLIREMRKSLKKQTWLTDRERNLAVDKLDDLVIFYGIPSMYYDKNTLNYDPFSEDIEIDTNKSFLQNNFMIYKNARKYEFDQVGKKNSKLWMFLKNDESIVYLPFKNVLIINTEIIADEVFLKDLPPLFAYTFIGPFIAQKIAKGYDLIGRLFNNRGEFNTWWSEKTTQKFFDNAKCLNSQFNEYFEPSTGLKVSGQQTLLENISDQIGLKLLYATYVSVVSKKGGGVTIPAFEKYTPRQIFWILYAQAFCSSHSEETMKHFMVEELSAPDQFRVIGTMSNFIEFALDFKCPYGSAMNPIEKCVIWD